MKNLTMIVAMDKNGAIAKDGKIPWKLSADMKHFSDYTRGKPVVMGRKTYESLPTKFKPLPERPNIIVTRNHEFVAPGCTVFVNPFFVYAIHKPEVCIIGGLEIYNIFLPRTNKIIVTHVEANVGGDIFFPVVFGNLCHRVLFSHPADEKNQFAFSVVEYTIT